MSLILDALNRSRRDTGAVPDIASRHYPDSAEPGPWGAGRWRARLPWLALLAALLVIAALLLERRWHSHSRAAPAAALGIDTVSEPAVRPAAPAPTAAGAPATVAPAPSAAGPADPSPTTPPTPLPAPAAGTAAAAAPPPIARDAAAVAALYRQPQSAAAPAPSSAGATADHAPPAAAKPDPVQPEERALAIERLAKQAQNELANRQLLEHPAPFLMELSQQTRDSIPTILYARHDYVGRPAAGDSGRSTVTLNGKLLRVGDSAAPGLSVEAILADSVVLNYRGTAFRLRALNSWVNL